MANYNSFSGPLSGLVWGFVSGGDDTDPASDHSGNSRVIPFDMSSAGSNMTDFPFNPRATGATQAGQQMFGGVPDPGTPVLMMKSLGNRSEEHTSELQSH